MTSFGTLEYMADVRETWDEFLYASRRDVIRDWAKKALIRCGNELFLYASRRDVIRDGLSGW